jgi:hypothetical protein
MPKPPATLEDLEKSDPGWLEPHVELAAIYYKLHRPEDGQREREIVQQIEARQQKEGPQRKITSRLQEVILSEKQRSRSRGRFGASAFSWMRAGSSITDA